MSSSSETNTNKPTETKPTAPKAQQQYTTAPPTKRSRAVLADDTDNVPFVPEDDGKGRTDDVPVGNAPVPARPRYMTRMSKKQYEDQAREYTQMQLQALRAPRPTSGGAVDDRRLHEMMFKYAEQLQQSQSQCIKLQKENRDLQDENEHLTETSLADEEELETQRKTILQKNQALARYEQRDRRRARTLPWRACGVFVLMWLWVIVVAHVNYTYNGQFEARYKVAADNLNTMWEDFVTHVKAARVNGTGFEVEF